MSWHSWSAAAAAAARDASNARARADHAQRALYVRSTVDAAGAVQSRTGNMEVLPDGRVFNQVLSLIIELVAMCHTVRNRLCE